MSKYPKIAEHIKNLFMEPRSIGSHAGGVLICPNLENHMPVIKVRGESTNTVVRRDELATPRREWIS